MRLDCMKPATALQHYLQPVPLCRPPFSRSSNEASASLLTTWQDISGLSAGNTVMTKGVRDGIFLALEGLAAAGQSVAVTSPADVYPVYEKIVQKTTAAINHRYETLGRDFCLDSTLAEASDAGDATSVLLLPHPLTPLGRSLTPEEVSSLAAWLSPPSPSAPPRYLLLDCVYSFELVVDNALLAPLLKLPNVAALHSLAKGWISPFLEPNVVTPPRSDPSKAVAPPGPVARSNFSNGIGFLHTSSPAWRRQVQLRMEQLSLVPLQSSCEQALLTLQRQPDLPHLLSSRLRAQWGKLTPHLRAIDPSFEPPSSGYFCTLRGHWAELFSTHRAISVPASVFGAPDNEERSVISCLYDIKDDDFAAAGPSQWTVPGLQAPNGREQPVVTPMYHVTTLSNFIKGYDKYSRRYSKAAIPESTFADKFFLLHAHQLPTGVEKASTLLRKLNIADDCLLVLHTEISTPHACGAEEDDLLVPHPKGQYVRRNWVSITDLSILPAAEGSTLEGISVEEAAARSLCLQQPNLLCYQHVTPRSVSIMPIAKGCQAKCPFCFSKGSVSDDMRQQRMYEEKIEAVLEAALARGAERAVITGGGEPFMLPFPRMLALVGQCAAKFSTVCAITNGYSLSQLAPAARLDALRALDKAGLTVLSLSRHAVTEDENERIMWLRTESHKVAETWRDAIDSNSPLTALTRLRWVCVLQKGGVDSAEQLHAYMAFVAASGANEVCFKELYVSTTVESVYHDHASNVWSNEHQVPLSLVLDFCESNGFERIGELPWGAPLFEGVYHGKTIRVAAYTEPSVFWERAQGLCRSWNYMANGEVLASLEDKNSQVDITAHTAHSS